MPTSRTIVILTALEIELAPIAQALSLQPADNGRYFEGGDDRTHVLGFFAGMGKDAIKEAYAQIIAGNKPDLTVLAGFCGACSSMLEEGFAFFPRWVIDESGQGFVLDDDIPQAVRRVAGDTQAHEVNQTLLTTSKVVVTGPQKQGLGHTHGAAAVDMESFHVAELAAAHQCPLMVIRCVSDGPAAAPPAWSSKLVTPQGRTRLAGAIAHLMLHPWHLPAMLEMRRSASKAAASLAACTPGRISRYLESHDRT